MAVLSFFDCGSCAAPAPSWDYRIIRAEVTRGSFDPDDPDIETYHNEAADAAIAGLATLGGISVVPFGTNLVGTRDWGGSFTTSTSGGVSPGKAMNYAEQYGSISVIGYAQIIDIRFNTAGKLRVITRQMVWGQRPDFTQTILSTVTTAYGAGDVASVSVSTRYGWKDTATLAPDDFINVCP